MQRINGERITIIFDQELVDGFAEIQKEVKITRSEFVRLCVAIGIESYKDGSLFFTKNIIDLGNLPKR